MYTIALYTRLSLPQLLYTTETELRLRQDKFEHVMLVPSGAKPTGVDFHYTTNKFYWVDVANAKLYFRDLPRFIR